MAGDEEDQTKQRTAADQPAGLIKEETCVTKTMEATTTSCLVPVGDEPPSNAVVGEPPNTSSAPPRSRRRRVLKRSTADWIMAHKRERFSGGPSSSRSTVVSEPDPYDPQVFLGNMSKIILHQSDPTCGIVHVRNASRTKVAAEELHEALEDEIADWQKSLRSELETKGCIETDDDQEAGDGGSDDMAFSLFPHPFALPFPTRRAAMEEEDSCLTAMMMRRRSDPNQKNYYGAQGFSEDQERRPGFS